MKKLPDCRNSPAKASGKRRWACSIASAPRLTPSADRGAHRNRVGDRGQHARGQRARVQRAGGVPLVAIAGRQQRDAVARERAGRDLRGGVVGEARELVELGAVVGDEQRQRLVVARVVGTPDGDLQLGAQGARRDGQRVGRARRPLGSQPRRRRVAGQLDDRLLAERAGGAQRVGRIGRRCSRAPSARCDRERVLEAPELRAPACAASIRLPRARSGPRGDREAAVGRTAGRRPAPARDRGGGRRCEPRSTSGPAAAVGDDTAGTLAGVTTMPPPASLTVLLVGGPTAVLEYAGLRLLTDPTFDPPGEHEGGLTKLTGPAVAADESAPIDAVLALPRPPRRQPRPRRARVPGARRAHADHHRRRRAPGRQRDRPRAVGVDRARAPGGRRRHRHRGPRAARPRGQRADHRPRDRLRPARRRRPDALRQRRQRLGRRRARRSPSAWGRSSSPSCSPAASACPQRFDGAYLTLSAERRGRGRARSSAPARSSRCTSRAGRTSPRARDELRAAFAAAGIGDRLVVPEPGASVSV